jgi:hypothetical protein
MPSNNEHSPTSNYMRLWRVTVTEPKGYRQRKAWRTEFIAMSTSESGAVAAVKREHPTLFREGATSDVDTIKGVTVEKVTYRT